MKSEIKDEWGNCRVNDVNMPESQFSEDKQSLGEMQAVVETVAAFASCQGGTIRVGITPHGERVGVKIGRTTLEDLARDIKQNTDPPQFPSIIVEGAETSAVIYIQVESSRVKPVFAYQRPFKRVGRTNQKLTREEVQRLMEETTGRTWDTLPCPEASLREIDADLVRRFLQRMAQDVTMNASTMLANLYLLTPQGEPGNGAVLLFSRTPQRFFPQALVQCARFDGITSVTFLDEETFEGDILSQLESAIKFVTRNTRKALRITGRPEHEVIPEYPAEALREAIINAICHRNYADISSTQIRIYDDRLEVWNPGSLPPGIMIDELYHEHPSRPRNPRLAQALHRAQLIEHRGTGTVRIVQACEESGLPRPEFITEQGMFKVRFISLVEKEEPVTVALTERQRQTIAYIRAHGAITRNEYEKLFQVKKAQAYRDLNELVSNGILLLERKGYLSSYLLVSP